MINDDDDGDDDDDYEDDVDSGDDDNDDDGKVMMRPMMMAMCVCDDNARMAIVERMPAGGRPPKSLPNGRVLIVLPVENTFPVPFENCRNSSGGVSALSGMSAVRFRSQAARTYPGGALQMQVQINGGAAATNPQKPSAKLRNINPEAPTHQIDATPSFLFDCPHALRHLAASIRVHGYGVINTARAPKPVEQREE